MVRLWGRLGSLLVASLVVVSLLFIILDDKSGNRQSRPIYNVRSLKTKPQQSGAGPPSEDSTTEKLAERSADQPSEPAGGQRPAERTPDQSANRSPEVIAELLQQQRSVDEIKGRPDNQSAALSPEEAAAELSLDEAVTELVITTGANDDNSKTTAAATAPPETAWNTSKPASIKGETNKDLADSIQATQSQEILRIKSRPVNGAPPGALSAPPPVERALFSYQDLFSARPVNVRASAPVQYGLNMSIARLNYEFATASPGGLLAVAAANRLSFRPPAVKKPNRMGFVGDIPVGDPVPVQAARHILIATTWRSGSTFLGDLLNHYPGTFYYFEPLHWTHSLGDFANTVDIGQLLRSLFRCEFSSKNLGYLHHVAKYSNRFLVKHNFRLWNTCHNLLPKEMMCFMPDYMSAVCPTFPIKLIKTVRLRVRKTEELLADTDLNLKVVVLVRDPRGVYASRTSGPILNWCKNEQCANAEIGCSNLLDDLKAVEELSAKYPGRLLLLRYEDLSIEPETTTRSLLKFLSLPWNKEMKQFLLTHTSQDRPKLVKNTETNKMERQSDPYSTSRNSTATAFKWRDSLTWPNISAIQEVCSEPMVRLGYRLLEGEQELLAGISPLDVAAKQEFDSNAQQLLSGIHSQDAASTQDVGSHS